MPRKKAKAVEQLSMEDVLTAVGADETQAPAAETVTDSAPTPSAPQVSWTLAPRQTPPSAAAPEQDTAPDGPAAPQAAVTEAAVPEAAATEMPAPEKAATEATAPEVPAPQKTAPRKELPQATAPKAAAPKKAAPKRPAPKRPAPKKAIPKKAAPKRAEPKKAEPKKTAPKAAARKPSGSPSVRRGGKRAPLTRLADMLGALILLYSLPAMLFSYAAGRSSGNTALLLDGLGGAVPPLVCLFAGLALVGCPRLRAGTFHGDASRLRTLYALVIALLAAVGELVSSALRLALPLDTAGALAPQGIGGWLTVLGLNCILVPLAQELLYRGFLQPLLTDWGERFALLVTGLLFALAGHSLAAFLPRLALSVLLGMAALRLGGVRVSAPLHTLYQLLAALLLYGARNSGDLTTLGFLLLILAVCFVFGVYGAVLLVRQRLPRPERRRDPRNRPGRVEQLLVSPPFFAALICGIALMLLQSLIV